MRTPTPGKRIRRAARRPLATVLGSALDVPKLRPRDCVAWRHARGWTQREAAYALGVSVRRIKRVEDVLGADRTLALAMRAVALPELMGAMVLAWPWEAGGALVVAKPETARGFHTGPFIPPRHTGAAR